MLLTLREPDSRRGARRGRSRDRCRSGGARLELRRDAAACGTSVTTIVLPCTRVSYGTRLSTFSTTRVRPFASATLTVSSAPCLTSMRREDIATDVSGRSSAMRAGLSTVNVSGCRRRVAQPQRQLHLVAGERWSPGCLPGDWRPAPARPRCRARERQHGQARGAERSSASSGREDCQHGQVARAWRRLNDDILGFSLRIIRSAPARLDARCSRRDRRARFR